MVILFFCITTSIIGLAAQGGVNIIKNDEGDNIIYQLELTKGSGIQAADYVLSYNGEALEYVDAEKGPLAEGDNIILAQNHVPEEQKIYCSYASLNSNENGGTILKMRFKKKNVEINTPIIGIDIVDQYNGENAQISEKSVTGDPSVATVESGKAISDPDSGAVQVTEATELAQVTDSKSANEAENRKNEAVQNTKSNAENAMNVQPNIAVLFAILVVMAILATLIIIFLKKRKTND